VASEIILIKVAVLLIASLGASLRYSYQGLYYVILAGLYANTINDFVVLTVGYVASLALSVGIRIASEFSSDR
jgi:hypothetical protein